MPGGSRVRRHLWISGHVQGVWFRESARRQAERLHVQGWAKNLEDGRVEVVFEGPREAVEQFIRWCQRGPPAARVDHVEVQSEPSTGEFLRFQVLR